ncbi:MAG: VWA domain-containing protein [Deltaproteobacteria bacterium]|nr:VWA domain-containing protein [Deltaproteobacteria bacterium]MDQ3298657.1 VWA domain-containing protein [Myxococcota bacterium]
MSRVRRSPDFKLGSKLVLAMCAAVVPAVLAACGSVARDAGGGETMHADVHVSIEVTESYAAMDEIPVGGGELRFVAPRPMRDPAGARDGASKRTLASGEMQAIAFPLRHTDVRTKVSGMSAIYTIEQTFENPYDEPIDAVYVFPLGDEAAVTEYAIVIGERTVAGVIKKKAEARATYEEARASGHTAALLEQEKRNVFKQRIANIAPRETIKVRFEYVELLDYDEGQYEIAFPFVVGPRYLPAEALGKSPVGAHHAGTVGRGGVTSIPYASPTVAGSTISFTADVDAGVPVLGVSSPSHQLRVTNPSPTRRHIELAGEGELPNRDLVVRYRTAADTTMVGVLAHRTDDRGYFTLVVQPKATYRTGDITPREVMIVIDTSGSMNGQPIAQAKALASALVDSLGPQDTFDIIGFAGSIDAMSEQPVYGTPANKAAGQAFLEGLHAGGGTEMGTAIAAALATDPGVDRVRMVYFLTDGYVGNDDVIVSAARTDLGHNRIYTVGVGSAPNRSLLNQLAVAGRGFPSYLNLGENAQELGTSLVRRTAYPYLTDIKIEWNGLAVGGVTPAAIPDVYAGMPLVVSGIYTQPGQARITVSATTAGRRISIPVTVTLPDRVDAEPVAALWARKRIDELLETAGETVSSSVVSQVTELGLAFHMVTAYTSFVAVDRTRVVQPGGASKLVEQPALMPAGVNGDTAIGPAEDAPPTYTASRRSSPSSSRRSSSSDYGGGGWGGGGDVDLLTLLLALALLPLAWTLRRMR